MSFRTEQETFWAGEFGTKYTERNEGERLFLSKLFKLREALRTSITPSTIIELGCNRGLNLRVLQLLYPDAKITGLEINPHAAELAKRETPARVLNCSITEPISLSEQFDLVLVSGVLIHVNPQSLPQVYENIYKLSSKYVLLSEYYSPQPVEIEYRGQHGKLFKRDFAGDLIEKFGFNLLDYGFSYHRETTLMNDDSTWFLLGR